MDESFEEAIESNLIWLPELGWGYFPVKSFVYDQRYLNHYLELEQGQVSDALNKMRVDLVRKYIGEDELVDIGIGSGVFIKKRGHDTFGFDVNPLAIARLVNDGIFRDPYISSVKNIACWDTLEHIPKPSLLIRQVRNYIFVSIPLFQDLPHLLASKHLKKNEHFYYFTEDGIQRWFQLYGFAMIEKNEQEQTVGREDIFTLVFKRDPSPD